MHADIVPEAGESVPVVIWDVSDEYDWDTLDIYEGFPKYYVKERVVVYTNDEKFITAIVYVMNSERKGICPPSEGYFSICEKGCIDNAIDSEYLYDALNYSWDNMTDYNQYKMKGAI